MIKIMHFFSAKMPHLVSEALEASYLIGSEVCNMHGLQFCAFFFPIACKLFVCM